MYSCIKTVTLQGLEGSIVDVEVDLTRSLPKFSIVGLADQSIKESAERVRSAIKNSGYQFPLNKITVNLAPADMKKDGSQMDLPIAMGIIAANSGLEENPLEDYVVLGELTLDGKVNGVRGALPMIITAREFGFKKCIIPFENKSECSLIRDMEIYPVKNLRDIVEFYNGEEILERYTEKFETTDVEYSVDFSDIKGQNYMKRAMEVAAAGRHNLLMIGVPGSGKSMAAHRFHTILPHLTFEESVETTKIYSVAGLLEENSLVKSRPFRAPHHTSSAVALIGGGSIPKPGEISLAHNGVLYLDELPEFNKNVLEVLRQPMETGSVNISRANASITYPANFQFIASMNPCPCGYYMDQNHSCSCSMLQINRYLSKISQPLLDRIDIHIEVSAVDYKSISESEKTETSKEIRKRVEEARLIQEERFRSEKFSYNSDIVDSKIKKYCEIDKKSEEMMSLAFNKYKFSARTYNKLLKLARTIADLRGDKNIKEEHLLEAIRYRTLDSKYWSR